MANQCCPQKASESVVSGPASARNLLAMQVTGPNSGPAESGTPGWGQQSVFTGPHTPWESSTTRKTCLSMMLKAEQPAVPSASTAGPRLVIMGLDTRVQYHL